MWPYRVIKQSFYLKILSLMALLAFIPFAALGFYSVVQVHSFSQSITQLQIQQTIGNVLEQKSAILQKEADNINVKFLNVEQHLKILQRQAEYLFANKAALLSPTTIPLVSGSEGYLWEPFQDEYEKANLFISASAPKPFSSQDLKTAKGLEPLFMQTIKNEPLLKAVFFCFSESAWLIYPAMDVDHEISINKLPPDINVKDFGFYSIADEKHNPTKGLKWTDPYSDVTQWGMVVTAAMPVYLPSGTLRGVVGADLPIEFMNDKLLNLTFPEPHAFAFIRDHKGNLVATQSNELSEKLFSAQASPRISELKHEEPIQKISTSEGVLYLLSAPITSNGWVLQFVIPESDITAPIIHDANVQTSMQKERFTWRLLLFLLLGSLVVILFSYYFSKTVTEPINRLTRASQEIIKGNYRVHIPNTSSDEIGQLTRTFHFMETTIEKLIDELTKRAAMLEDRVSERTRELWEANLQLNEALLKLQQSETARTELLVQISHDLKTPLTSIKGYLQLLHDHQFPAEKQQEWTRLILLRTNHIIRLIDDLFEISAMELHETHFKKEWVPVEFLIEHAVDIARNNSLDAAVQFQMTFEDDMPLLFVDPAKVNRALINIIDNAIKYSQHHGNGEIRINAFQQQSSVVIEITDNGMGIADEHVEKIFTPFYRDPGVLQAQIIGTGLGLPISQKIIEGHKGEIHITSKKGVGTTVSISFPDVWSDDLEVV